MLDIKASEKVILRSKLRNSSDTSCIFVYIYKYTMVDYLNQKEKETMTAQIQLDIFRETTDTDVLRAEVMALKESHNAVRKRAFAEIGGLRKLVLEQQHEIDHLKVKLGLSCYVDIKM